MQGTSITKISVDINKELAQIATEQKVYGDQFPKEREQAVSDVQELLDNSTLKRSTKDQVERVLASPLSIKSLKELLSAVKRAIAGKNSTSSSNMSKTQILSELKIWAKGMGWKFLYVDNPDRVKVDCKNRTDRLMTHLYCAKLGSYYYEPINETMMDSITKRVYDLGFYNNIPVTTGTVSDVFGMLPTYFINDKSGGIDSKESRIESTNHNLITIDGGDIYYDMETRELVSGNELSDQPAAVSFYRLFDTKDDSDPKVPLIDTQLIDREVVERERENMHYAMYKYLHTERDGKVHHGEKAELELPDWAQPTFGLWADGRPCRAADMLIAISAILTGRNLHGAIFLTGRRANGKSVFLNLIRTIFGKNRLASVPLTDIGDPHSVGALRGCLANISEENLATDSRTYYGQLNIDTSTFKIAADGGSKDMPVLYSQQPVNLVFNFPMFFAYNTIPDWSREEDKEALYRRTLTIPFTHDFSQEDKHGDELSFERRTYTPEYCARVVGMIIGVSEALRDCDKEGLPLGWSQEMLDYQCADMERSYGAAEYCRLFAQHFNAFTSYAMLQADCANWIRRIQEYGGSVDDISEDGETPLIPSINAIKLAMREYLESPKRTSIGGPRTSRIKGYQLDPRYLDPDRGNGRIFMEAAAVPHTANITFKDCIYEHGRSVVATFKKLEDDAKTE